METVDSDLVNFVDYDISTNPNDFNINTLFSLVDSGVIKLPVFQRNYVWDKKRASKLIESIIMGLPIPQLFLYQSNNNDFLVIDGQQRLLSIYFFIKQRFPTDQGRNKLHDYLSGGDCISANFLNDDIFFKDFKLSLPNVLKDGNVFPNRLNGLKFETLGNYRHTFEFLRTIRCVIIKQTSPQNNMDSIFEIFNRLNTGGVNLTQQEIRMSLFYSNFYIALSEMNQDLRWRKLLNSKKVDVHFKDIEILLRSFAMLYQYKDYTSSMNLFLNNFSAIVKTFKQEEIQYCKDIFNSFLDCCSNLTAEDFASKSNKFSISLFESIFVAVCSNAFNLKQLPHCKISRESISRLKLDPEFIGVTQDAVASKSSVLGRIGKAIEHLDHD